MITRPSRLRFIERSLACFARQTLVDKELVIVHDGGSSFERKIEQLAGRYGLNRFRAVANPGPASLGELRNLSVACARGEFVCQWDDDDLCHPERLSVQFGKMKKDACDFNFMTDQLHLYERIGHLYWEDWSHFRKPRNWIHGTIIGRRDRFPRYPDEARGEDTALVQELVNRRASISLLSGKGYLYIYTYNGENCWTMRHHLAISQATRKPGHELEKLSDTLRRELSAYELPYRKIVLPHDSGAMEFAC